VKNNAKLQKLKILVCIYSCNAHNDLIHKFNKSPVIKFLSGLSNTRIIEVRADPNISEDVFSGRLLLLKTAESYQNLPRKSFAMIRYAALNFDFDYIVKIDVTTLTSALHAKLLTGGKEISESEMLKMLSNPNFYRDYNGYVLLNASRKGAEGWANKKAISIDYDQIFEEDRLPRFYSGKMWLINQNFANFIVGNAESVVNDFSKYFPAEDVMLGFLYQKYSI